MISKINEIKKQALKDINDAENALSLNNVWKKYLGRQGGELTKVLRAIKNLPTEKRPKIGRLANAVKQEIIKGINKAKNTLSSSKLNSLNNIDTTLPGKKIKFGHLHPLTQMRFNIAQIFSSLGFEVVESNEMETEYYNFEALNIPKGHPARDMWDTFFIESKKNQKSKLLLQTHTSPMQIHVMEKRKPPLKVCVIGKCFRNEATDVSHEHTIYQLEAFSVGKEISVANLIHTLKSFLGLLFKKEVEVRLRPSYFPFTEPSFEMDFKCLNCNGSGCPVCGQTGWIEILGCGMIHPKVYEAVGYPKNTYTGFAFGVGLDRLVMMKHRIDDIRWLHSGDLRFIRQF